MDEKDFLGKGWKFPLCVDKRTGKLAMVSFEDDIKEAVGILLRTHLGERVMREDFGTRAYEYLFESNATGFGLQVRDELQEALTQNEPRIADVEVTVGEDGGREGVVVVRVSYRVRSTNNYFNMVYPFYLMEGIEA